MTLPAQLRAIADRLEAATAMRREALVDLAAIGAGQLLSTLDDLLGDSASVVADEGAGGEAERSLPPPDAPIEQVTPDGSPGSGSARRRQPTISPASPGTDAEAVRVDRTPADQAGERGIDAHPPLHSAFDPLGAKPATVPCPECGEPFRPQGMGVHRKVHGHRAAVKAPATCPDCGKRIAQGQNLARHRQMVHAGQKPRGNGAGAPVMRKGSETWVCSRCPEAFHTREARDLHQAMHPPVPPAMPVRTVGA